MAVGRHVQRLVVVQQLEQVGGCGAVDDGRRDQLVHGFVVRRLAGVVHEAGAAAGDGAGEEGHADGFLMRDALERADEVGAFEVLGGDVSESGDMGGGRVADFCFMRPLVFELVQHVDVTERAQESAHEP